MHRCPAVPTAPKTAPGTTTFRSALGAMIIALFPPNSNNALPSLAPTKAPTLFPIRVEPVAEIKGTRESFAINLPISASPITNDETPSGTPFALKTSFVIN